MATSVDTGNTSDIEVACSIIVSGIVVMDKDGIPDSKAVPTANSRGAHFRL